MWYNVHTWTNGALMKGYKRMDNINKLINLLADDLFEALYGDANDPDGTTYKEPYIYEIHNIFDELQDLVDLKQKLTLKSLMQKLIGLEYELIRIVSENLDAEKLELVAENIGREMNILVA